MNIIESEQKAFEEISDTSKNVIKIDNFVIYEKNDGTNSNDTLTNNENTDKNMKSEGFRDNDKIKIHEILKNVEHTEASMKNAQKLCIMCNLTTDYNLLLKFKNLEEFLYFLKYCFLSKYKDYVQEDCPGFEKNKENFFEYLKNYEKYYKSGYIFKSIKYLCQKCFKDTLKQNNGFHTLFNLLHISSSILNSNIVKPPKKIEKLPTPIKHIEVPQIDQKDQPSYNNYTEIDKSNYNIIISREVLKKHKPNNEIEMNISNNTNNSNNSNNSNNFKNLIEIMKTNVTKLPNIKKTQGGINLNPPQVSVSSNIQNMVKMPNNKKINNLSLNLLIGNNNLNFMNNQNPQSNLEQNQQKISSNLGKLNELINKFEGLNEVTPNINLPKHDDRENSTINTNNETDKNDIEKKKDFGNNVYNILDDLKTQVASMHYYSMVQKYFINYIFKNVESFIEQIAPNSNIRQSLGDIIDSNCSNFINNYPLVNPNDPNNKNPTPDPSNILKKMTGNSLNLPNLPNLPNNLPNLPGFPNFPNLPNIGNVPNLQNNLFNLPNNNVVQQMMGNNNPQNMPDLMTLQSLMNQIQTQGQGQGQANNLPNNPLTGNNPLNNLFGNMMNNNNNHTGANNNPPDMNKNIYSELFKSMDMAQNNLTNNTNNMPNSINPGQNNNNNGNINFLTPNNNPSLNKNKPTNHLINNLIPNQPNNTHPLPNNQNNQPQNLQMGNLFPNNFMQCQPMPQNNIEQYQKMLFSKTMNGNNNLGNMHNLPNLQGMPNINLPILNNNNPSNQSNNNTNNQMGFQELLNTFRNPMGNMMGNPSMNVINQGNPGFSQENPFNMGNVNPNPNNNGNMMNSSFLSHLTNLFNNQNNNNNK
jgi:hypothetical protein